MYGVWIGPKHLRCSSDEVVMKETDKLRRKKIELSMCQSQNRSGVKANVFLTVRGEKLNK